jgi:CheY-like chemotaxis protein
MPLDAGSHVQAIAPRVLVADDQADIVTALQLLLRDAGLDADAAASIQGVRERLEAQSYDLPISARHGRQNKTA